MHWIVERLQSVRTPGEDPERPIAIDRDGLLLFRPLRPAINMRQMLRSTLCAQEIAVGIELYNRRQASGRIFRIEDDSPTNRGSARALFASIVIPPSRTDDLRGRNGTANVNEIVQVPKTFGSLHRFGGLMKIRLVATACLMSTFGK